MSNKLEEWLEALPLPALLAILLAVIATVIAPFIVFFSTGLCSGYGEGVREGYLTRVSERGIVWRTTEAEVQMGAGAQASLQNVQKLSASDPEIVRQLNEKMGHHVRIRYKQWLIQPMRLGETNYQIVAVEDVPPK